MLDATYYIEFLYIQETWRKAIMYPYHHGRNLFSQLKANTISIWRGEELPEEPQQDKLYGHCIMFFETMSESMMQLCLNSVIIREFGLSPNVYERSNQISGLVSSLLSVIILFAKVRTKKIIVFIPLGFSLFKGNQLYAYLRNSYHTSRKV